MPISQRKESDIQNPIPFNLFINDTLTRED